MVAVQLRLPLPAFVILIVFAAGFPAPLDAEKVRSDGLTRSAAGLEAELSDRVIGTVTGEPAAPAALMVIEPVWVPAASPAITGERVTVLGAVPDVADSVSQLRLSLIVQFKVPPPLLEIVIDLAAGIAPPAVPVKLTLAGVTDKAGVAESVGLCAGPAPLGVNPDEVVSSSLSKAKPSSRIHTLTVCTPAELTISVALRTLSMALDVQAQLPMGNSEICSPVVTALPSSPTWSESSAKPVEYPRIHM